MKARATKEANQRKEVNHVLCRQKARSVQISLLAKQLEGREKFLLRKFEISSSSRADFMDGVSGFSNILLVTRS